MLRKRNLSDGMRTWKAKEERTQMKRNIGNRSDALYSPYHYSYERNFKNRASNGMSKNNQN